MFFGSNVFRDFRVWVFFRAWMVIETPFLLGLSLQRLVMIMMMTLMITF